MIKETSSPIYYDDFDIHYYDDGKPPKHKWLRFIIVMIIITIGFFVVASLHGCNVYNKLQNNPPITNKDSSELSQSCVKTFPAKPNTIVVGAPIIKTNTVIIVDSNKIKLLIKKSDSLFNIITFQNELLNNSPNIDSLKAKWEDEVLQGCGTFDETTDSIFIPTTITVHSSEDSALIFNLRSNNNDLSNQLLVSNSKVKDRTNLCWIEGGISFLLILGLGFSVAKLFQKNAIV